MRCPALSRAALAVLVIVGAAAADPLRFERRLGADDLWRPCTLGAETRLASPCMRPALLATHKGRRIPASGVLRVPLPRAPHAPLLIDVEAFSYIIPPTDRVARLAMRRLDAVLARAHESDRLARTFAPFSQLRPEPQAREIRVQVAPDAVTLRFDPTRRDTRAMFAVWGWVVATPRLELELGTIRPRDRLAVAFGVPDRGRDSGSPPVRFSVALTTPGAGAPRELWRRTLDPSRVDRDRTWQEAVLDLDADGAPRTVVLAAEAEGEGAALASWARPAVLHAAADPAPPPSVILLSIDTLRADHVGVYGARRPTTPNLDRLAAEGVVFEQALAPFPSTTASHMTMLTSLEPCAHGVIAPGSPRLASSVPTLTERLAARGYATAAVTEDGLIVGELGFDRGFDSYRELSSATPEPLGLFARGIALVEDWLQSHADVPFFLFFHTYQVHEPYKIAPHLQGLFAVPADAPRVQREEVAYDTGVRHADELLATFVDFLRGRGLLERTLLVVTADHGTEFGEHGGIGHARGVHEEQLRVPLIVHHPTLASGGRRVRTPVGLVDLAPTLIDLAGAAAPQNLAGRSLAPLLRGSASDLSDARALFGEQLWGPRQTVLRTRRHAWIERQGVVELYDLADDPGEHHDLAAAEPRLAAEGARRIAAFRDACRPPRSRSAPSATAVDPERAQRLRALGYAQ